MLLSLVAGSVAFFRTISTDPDDDDEEEEEDEEKHDDPDMTDPCSFLFSTFFAFDSCNVLTSVSDTASSIS